MSGRRTIKRHKVKSHITNAIILIINITKKGQKSKVGETMEEIISLQEIYEVIKKRFLIIITCTLVPVFIAVVASFFILTPIYE